MTNRATFRLFHYPATRSARVKWLMHELLDEDFTVEVVPLYEGAQYEADFRRMNPNHNVPVLEINMPDGTTKHMLESGAIIAFLADAFPEKGLAPPAGEFSVRRADYLQMLHFGASWMDMMLWQIRIHVHILPDGENDPATAERYKSKFANEVEPQLKQRLDETRYICGDEFCAADCIVAHNVAWARRYGLCSDRTFRRYQSIVAKRPAFALAFADAHQFDPQVPADAKLSGNFSG